MGKLELEYFDRDVKDFRETFISARDALSDLDNIIDKNIIETINNFFNEAEYVEQNILKKIEEYLEDEE